MLSGYAPGAAAVNAVGAIAKDLKAGAQGKPGSFFWGECRFLLCQFPSHLLSAFLGSVEEIQSGARC
jgi:hypothetical protein